MIEKYLKSFRERLKELRVDKNLTISQLAKEIEVNPSTIIRWESGDRTPTIDKAIILALYFNVNLDYLLGLEN